MSDIKKGEFNAVDLSGMVQAAKLTEQDNKKSFKRPPGIDCGNRREPIPHFVKADCETVIPGKNNSYIVLGKDRPSSIHSGYGGKGDTQCGMIDLVVGRMHPTPKEEFKYEGATESSPVMVDPMFKPYKPQDPSAAPVEFATDAARIYISQKTKIDEYFLPPSLQGKFKRKSPQSGIGIKADAVRIMGAEGIKLITNPDQVNSYGQPLATKGIDLIAMDWAKDYDITYEGSWTGGQRPVMKKGPAIQPLVKGDNLQACLEEIVYEIKQIMSTNQKFVNYMIHFLDHYSQHIHAAPMLYVPVLPDGTTIDAAVGVNNGLGTTIMSSYKAHVWNIGKIEKKYLSINNTNCYINSKYNNTN